MKKYGEYNNNRKFNEYDTIHSSKKTKRIELF